MARAKKSRGEEGGNERWLLTYADLITLLVVFFIILYAQSIVDQHKFSELALSFRQTFSVGVLQGAPNTGAIIGRGGRVGPIQISQINYIQNQIGKAIEDHNLTNEVTVGMQRDGLHITIEGSVLFRSGEVSLRSQAGSILDQVAPKIRSWDGQIRIEGNTDNIPFHSTLYPSNWELSTARAVSVLHYFVNQQSLNPSSFVVQGNGQYKPLVPNDSAENRAKNRRVEIVLLRTNQPQPVTAVPPGPTALAIPVSHPATP